MMNRLNLKAALPLLLGMLMLSGVDQLSKTWAKMVLSQGHSLVLWPDKLQLTLAYNTGAAFSLFQSYPHLLSAITVVIFLCLLGYSLTRTSASRAEAMAMMLILGGALGNLWDRVTVGRVTDFIDVVAIHYPIFNVADSFIFIGVLLMIRVLWMGQSIPAIEKTGQPNGIGQ